MPGMDPVGPLEAASSPIEVARRVRGIAGAPWRRLFGYLGRTPRRVSTEVQDAIARSTVTAEEALGGIRVVKSFGREGWETNRYAADLAGVVGAATRLALCACSFGTPGSA